jgi:multidrug efflux pump subunit AcrB
MQHDKYNTVNKKNKLPAFSVIMIFVLFSIIGLSFLPVLNVKLFPTTTLPRTNINFSWHNASARVIEQEITSKIEGAVGRVKGVRNISSVSRKGSGNVSIEFKKGVDLDAARFELSSIIRQLYPSLPEGVSYPNVVMYSTDRNDRGPIHTYTLNASAATSLIQEYAENNIVNRLSLIDGINKVSVYGGTPHEWVVKTDFALMEQLGISATEVRQAISNYFDKKIVGMANSGDTKYNYPLMVRLSLEHQIPDSVVWNNIPVKTINNRLISLGDIAKVKCMEQPPQAYFRVNGLNMVNIVVYPNDDANNLVLDKKLKAEVDRLRNTLPNAYSLILVSDATTHIKTELRKVWLRTLLSIGFLLLFVFLVHRKPKYLLLIFTSIVINLSVAVIFYHLLKIEVHIYALAGLAVSFGMIVDNTIIMIDHIIHRGNRKAFVAILAATLTTIGALSVIFLLNEGQRVNLIDFALVVIVNLSVSVVIALLFIPAMIEKMNFTKKFNKSALRRMRHVSRVVKFYARFIRHTKRFKIIYILLIVFAFGIPVQWLPNKIEKENRWADIYNKSIGNENFTRNVKPKLEKFLGGTLNLFSKNVMEKNIYADPSETILYARASMPEGCTVHQLNESVKLMENVISTYSEVKTFETSVYGPQNGNITIRFTPEAGISSFPYELKERLTSAAIQMGGLDWAIYGVGQGFSNSLRSGRKSERIELEGYNYDMLYRYAELIKENLEENPRVRDLEIAGSSGWNTETLHEYYFDFDREKFARNNIEFRNVYTLLHNKLFRDGLNRVYFNGQEQPVSLVSSGFDTYNVWSLEHEPFFVGEKMLKLKDLAKIDKRKTGNNIHKNNQQYQLILMYNFIGPGELAQIVREQHVELIEKELPMGFRVKKQQGWGGWNIKDKKQYWLIAVVIVIIFFICSILLESIRQPLAIIALIPISFIGVFITFGAFGFNFDQGGFASFILLCGIVVNSGLYIINDYNQLKKQGKRSHFNMYLNAFNHKIIPIFLTIASTILGMVPFLFGGEKEIFWFSFAVGTIGGLLFSFIAIIVFLPLFMSLRGNHLEYD